MRYVVCYKIIPDLNLTQIKEIWRKKIGTEPYLSFKNTTVCLSVCVCVCYTFLKTRISPQLINNYSNNNNNKYNSQINLGNIWSVCMCVHARTDLACTARSSTVYKHIFLKFYILLSDNQTKTLTSRVYSQYLWCPWTDFSQILNPVSWQPNKHNKIY